jgi:hypothetical protein
LGRTVEEPAEREAEVELRELTEVFRSFRRVLVLLVVAVLLGGDTLEEEGWPEDLLGALLTEEEELRRWSLVCPSAKLMKSPNTRELRNTTRLT